MTLDLEALQRDVFLGTVLALFVLERFRALRRQPVPMARRWTSNIALFAIGVLAGALLQPLGIYAFAAQQPPGVLTRLGMPLAAQFVVTFVLLDFWKYWEHRLYHAVPLLWRFHLVHHSDTALDVTTAERHHPIEALLGIATLTAVVWALGLPPAALALYILVATVVALYSHANLRLPAVIDRPLSRLFVTGPVHAVHHSDLRVETDSNFGAVLTVWDRLFGTFVAPAQARIPHVGLDYFHRPADTGLGGVLLQPLRYRRDLVYPARDATPIDARSRATDGAVAWDVPATARATLLMGAVGIALVLVAMWPTVVEMMAVWRGESYQYAWLVLPMLVYLVGWHDDALRRALVPGPGMAGVWLALAAGVCWSAGAVANVDALRHVALVVALHAVALATLGFACYRRFFPALALLFFMVPAGDLLQPALRVLTLKSLELFTWLAQLPRVIDGFVMTVGPRRYIVVDECAGLSYVTLAGFLGYCFGLMLYGSFLRSAGLALAGAAIGIACNVIRVNAIVLIDWMRDSQLDLTAHGTLQWIMLIAALAGLLYVLSRSRPEKQPAVATAPRAADPTNVRRYAPLAAGACAALLTAITGAVLASSGRPIDGAVAFPSRLSGFTLVAADRAWAVDPGARTQWTRARYAVDERELGVVLVQARQADAKVGEWVLAPGDRAVWREKDARRERGCAAADCLDLAHVTWSREESDDVVHAYFVYAVGAHATTSRLAARAVYGVHRITDGDLLPVVVAIVSKSPLDVDEAAAALRRLHGALLDATRDALAGSRAD